MTVPGSASEDRRRHMIADAAYYLAEKRGFDGRDPAGDWLPAKRPDDSDLAGCTY